MALMAVLATSWLIGPSSVILVRRLFSHDVEAKVAALLGPLVMLFGQDGTDQRDQRRPVGAPLSSSGKRIG
jgi:hypothetical protein